MASTQFIQSNISFRAGLLLLVCFSAGLSAHGQHRVEIGNGIDQTLLELKSLDQYNALIWDGGKAKLKNSFDLISVDRDWIRLLMDADNNQTNAEFSLYKDAPNSNGHTPIVKLNLEGFDSWINSGNLGIGDISPTERLTVNGAIKIGVNNFNTPGVIRFDSGAFEGYSNGAWRSLLEDADADPANEIQTLSLSDNKVIISSGNSVILPNSTVIEDLDKDTYINVEGIPDNDEIAIGIEGEVRAKFLKTAISGRTYLDFPNNGNNILLGAGGANIANNGLNNIYIGDVTGSFNANGSENVMIGKGIGTLADHQYENVFIGNGIGVGNIGSQNVILGHQAASASSLKESVLIGYQAGQSITSDTSFKGLICIGYQAGQSLNTTLTSSGGFFEFRTNTLIGHQAGRVIGSTGNVMIGGRAGLYTTTGEDNVFIGDEAGISNTDGSDNLCIGVEAGALTSGSNNICIGNDSRSSGEKSDNTLIGVQAISYADGVVLVGRSTSGGGEYYTAVGYDAGTTLGGPYCGSYGALSATTGPGQYRIGESSTTSTGGYTGWSNVSDGRFKSDIRENVPGLSFIKNLRPVTYHMKSTELAHFIRQRQTEPFPPGYSDQLRAKEQIQYTGFIAQEVEQTAQALGFDFSGVEAPQTEEDLYSLRYAEFVVPLVKAVQELSAENEGLKNEMTELRSMIEALQRGEE